MAEPLDEKKRNPPKVRTAIQNGGLPACLTVKELAARWRCRTDRVRAMIAVGSVQAINLAGRTLIPPEAIRQAEAGPLAVKPRKQRRRETIDPEVIRLLDL